LDNHAKEILIDGGEGFSQSVFGHVQYLDKKTWEANLLPHV